MMLAGETRSRPAVRETCPSASLSTSNLTWTDLDFVFFLYSLVPCTVSVLGSFSWLSCILPFVLTVHQT